MLNGVGGNAQTAERICRGFQDAPACQFVGHLLLDAEALGRRVDRERGTRLESKISQPACKMLAVQPNLTNGHSWPFFGQFAEGICQDRLDQADRFVVRQAPVPQGGPERYPPAQ